MVHLTDGIDVSGLNFVRVVHIPGNVLTPASWQQVVFIDDRASDDDVDEPAAAIEARRRAGHTGLGVHHESSVGQVAERGTQFEVRVGAGGVRVRAFASVGWLWGGRWTASPDYQHFSATGG